MGSPPSSFGSGCETKSTREDLPPPKGTCSQSSSLSSTHHRTGQSRGDARKTACTPSQGSSGSSAQALVRGALASRPCQPGNLLLMVGCAQKIRSEDALSGGELLTRAESGLPSSSVMEGPLFLNRPPPPAPRICFH